MSKKEGNNIFGISRPEKYIRQKFDIDKYVHSYTLDRELILKVKGAAQLIARPVRGELPIFLIEIKDIVEARAWTLPAALKAFDRLTEGL